MKGWYFAAVDKKLSYGDGRDIALGQTHAVKGDIALCKNGLHGSKRLIDALSYAKGAIIYRVDITSDIKSDRDKFCGRYRKYLAGGIDVSDVLGQFSRWSALQVVKNWDAPQVVIDWLETGDEKLRAAAKSAAESAEWSAAESAEWLAAKSAAESAAESAEWLAAKSAAKSAAESAEWSAAELAEWATVWSAARTEQNKKLTALIEAAIKKGGN